MTTGLDFTTRVETMTGYTMVDATTHETCGHCHRSKQTALKCRWRKDWPREIWTCATDSPPKCDFDANQRLGKRVENDQPHPEPITSRFRVVW
jgi:hypothetical protein